MTTSTSNKLVISPGVFSSVSDDSVRDTGDILILDIIMNGVNCLTLANSDLDFATDEENSIKNNISIGQNFFYGIELYNTGIGGLRKLIVAETGIGELIYVDEDSDGVRSAADQYYLVRESVFEKIDSDGNVSKVADPTSFTQFDRFVDQDPASYLVVTSYIPTNFRELCAQDHAIIATTEKQAPTPVEIAENALLGRRFGNIESLSKTEIHEVLGYESPTASLAANTEPLILATSLLQLTGDDPLMVCKQLHLQARVAYPTTKTRGYLIYNYEKGAFEGYDGNEWRQLQWFMDESQAKDDMDNRIAALENREEAWAVALEEKANEATAQVTASEKTLTTALEEAVDDIAVQAALQVTVAEEALAKALEEAAGDITAAAAVEAAAQVTAAEEAFATALEEAVGKIAAEAAAQVTAAEEALATALEESAGDLTAAATIEAAALVKAAEEEYTIALEEAVNKIATEAAAQVTAAEEALAIAIEEASGDITAAAAVEAAAQVKAALEEAAGDITAAAAVEAAAQVKAAEEALATAIEESAGDITAAAAVEAAAQVKAAEEAFATVLDQAVSDISIEIAAQVTAAETALAAAIEERDAALTAALEEREVITEDDVKDIYLEYVSQNIVDIPTYQHDGTSWRVV